MSRNVQGTRSYFMWVFLGIITLGICFIVYNLLNFLDLDEHNRRYASRENASSTDSQA